MVNAANPIDWRDVSPDVAARILSQGETFMSAQLQAAIAADSRATTMAGMFIMLALAVGAAGVAWFPDARGSAYLLASTVCAAILLLAAARAAWAARPIDFYFPGNQPSQWWPCRKGNLAELLGGESENYDARIEYNQDRLTENQTAIKDAFTLALISPILGAGFALLAIYFSSRA